MDLEKIIEERIKEMDIANMVKEVISKMVSDDIIRTLKRITETEISNIVKTEIEIVLAKPIETDDGWGKKEKYSSFEELFKQTFASKLSSVYDIQKIISSHTKHTIEALWEKNKSAAIEKITQEIKKL